MELPGKWYSIERNIKTDDLKISKIKETEKQNISFIHTHY